jgi:Holliday junction resolvase RusA-like endonuclease
MEAFKITRIPICPQTHVRSTQGDRWLFAVTPEYLAEYDAKKLIEKGRKGGNLRRLTQLKKYNAYKDSIRLWQAANRFKMPLGYFAIWFFIPAPVSWRKKIMEANIGKPHMSTPDCDNLLKSFFDGIMPRKNKTRRETGSDDRRIHCYAAFKVWCRQGEAGIVIAEYTPDPFLKAFASISPHSPLTFDTSHIF